LLSLSRVLKLRAPNAKGFLFRILCRVRMMRIERLKAVVSSVSVLLITLSVLALVVSLMGVVLSAEPSERTAGVRASAVAVLSLAISATAFLLFKRNVVTELSDAFIVVSIFWLLAPLFSAFIYSYSVGLPLIDAFFESLSGFTGTGLSVISRPEELPRVILAWRALTQWVGELGVVVFSGVLLPFLHRSIRSVYVAERGARIAPSVISTARRLFAIYAAYTLLGVLLFTVAGMGLFDSLVHSMTGIATGGMSTSSGNLGFWFISNSFVAVAASVVMILGALNFVDLYNLSSGRLRDFVKSAEVRGLVTSFAVFAGVLWVIALVTGSLDSFWVWVFHMISAHTTTGFSLTSIYEHPEAVKLVITLSMIVGGATFSTAGGIKMKRTIIAVKAIFWDIGRIFVPRSAVIARKVGDEVIKEEEIASVYSYIFLYMLTLVVLSLCMYISLLASGLSQYNYIDALFETASALSCVGLSVGITTSSAPVLVKVLLMVAMYLGRIEFLPLYIVVGAYYIEKVTL